MDKLKMGLNFDFGVQFDLEGQGQMSHKTIRILTKLFCTSGPNLVILAWTGDELSRGQARDYCTHRRTHRQKQATTIPEGQNWPRVKILPWKSRVKFMGEVTVQSHNVGPTFYGLTSLSFHVNRPSHPWDTAFSKYDLENPWSRSNDHDVAQLQV